MNAVLYFSGTGGSKKVAEKLAARLDMQATDIIELYRCGAPLEFERVAVVFPVYSQGVPSVLKPVFKKLRADAGRTRRDYKQTARADGNLPAEEKEIAVRLSRARPSEQNRR